MRRNQSEFEQAEREFKAARREFVSVLDTWEGAGAKVDLVYKEKLQRLLHALEKRGSEAVEKALQSTIANLPVETVWHPPFVCFLSAYTV